LKDEETYLVPYISDIELTHDLVEIYLMTKNCSDWETLGQQVGISERNLGQIRSLYESEADNPVYKNRARVTMIHRFLTLDPETHGDINQKLDTLAEALLGLDCIDQHLYLGMVTKYLNK